MDRLFGVLLILVSAASFGAMPVFARFAYEAGSNPITVLFLRFSIASVFMLIVMVLRGIAFPKGRTFIALVLMGGVGYVCQTLSYFTALTLASAGLVAILLYLYPALVVIFTVLFLKDPITKNKTLALILALAGTMLTIGLDGGGQSLGIILAITAAIIYSVYIIVGSKVIRKADAFSSSAVIMVSAGVVSCGLVAVHGGAWPATMAGWISIVAISLVSTVLGIVTFLEGLRRIGPANASMLSTLEPVVTVSLAAIVLGEAITFSRIVGGMMVLSAVTLLAKSEPKTANNKD
ncbi:MAG: DMT family transporter [Deltaproteobacteria bacterium]|nr:DMT family transporter [Deltaproteobacteria bacterium]